MGGIDITRFTIGIGLVKVICLTIDTVLGVDVIIIIKPIYIYIFIYFIIILI